METKILFDSRKYLRKIPLIITVFDGKGDIAAKETLEFSRIVAYQTTFYKRILLQTAESDVADSFISLQDLLNKKKIETGDKAYISICAKPQGTEADDAFVCFLDESTTPFGEASTASAEKVFTTYLNEEFFIIVNDKKISYGIYNEHVAVKTELGAEEIDFVKETIIAQNNPEWFPSEKELLEVQKQLLKEKKAVEKKEKGGFFTPKKKEKPVAVVSSETGEYINPKSLKSHHGSTNPDYELNNIIGLEGVKKDIQKMRYMLDYEKNRKQRGITTSDASTLHMCFMGHPGTGKTTIARIMTGILFSMGYIKNNRCIEISGLDLQGGYVGQTAIITKQIVDIAKGGILFIDEAYALCENKENSYGTEAISVLLKEMEDNRGDLIVIFAGYEDDMNKFLNVNPGFRSRINKYFQFADYTPVELGRILLNYIHKMHLKIDEPTLIKCLELFKEAKKHPNFSNGRFVRNLTEKIEEEHILNTINSDIERMDLIVSEDLPDKVVQDMLYGM